MAEIETNTEDDRLDHLNAAISELEQAQPYSSGPDMDYAARGVIDDLREIRDLRAERIEKGTENLDEEWLERMQAMYDKHDIGSSDN